MTKAHPPEKQPDHPKAAGNIERTLLQEPRTEVDPRKSLGGPLSMHLRWTEQACRQSPLVDGDGIELQLPARLWAPLERVFCLAAKRGLRDQ